jgi:pimeloyl-ACP methyl ester carboxylesterase
MPMLETEDATLHVEVDGSGDPITVLAHGLTNSCEELAPFAPMLPGTKVRFCFRGHGHSSAPKSGYGFGDFARDLDAVANAYGATRAVGTSLGAGAICRLVAENPARFQRIVLVLPAALDAPMGSLRDGLEETARILETLPKDQAIEAILSGGGRLETYERAPWLRDFDMLLWQDMNPTGVARAIRGVIGDVAVRDREQLRSVEAPTLIIAREGDAIHPAELARILASIMPNAELIVLPGEVELIEAIPTLLGRVSSFLADE